MRCAIGCNWLVVKSTQPRVQNAAVFCALLVTLIVMPRMQLTGTVVSDKMEKTCVVMVQRLVQHPLLKKYVNTRKKFMAHDEGTSRVTRTITECLRQ